MNIVDIPESEVISENGKEYTVSKSNLNSNKYPLLATYWLNLVGLLNVLVLNLQVD